MSKFIDKLNKLTRSEAQPMGFRAKQQTPAKPKIQLIATLAQEHAEGLSGHIVGADAGIIRFINVGKGETETFQKISQAIPDIPWGGWVQNGGLEIIEQLIKAGYDFITFPAASTPLAIIENAKTGNILEIEPSISEGLLRASNELPVDAVLISNVYKEGHTLTWQNLMLLQHFARLLTRPLLVCIPSKVTGGEIKALWEAGTSGVVLELGPEEPQDSIGKLRDVIDKLEFPATRRREKIQPRLSYSTREQGKVTTEEEEEEEEG